MPPAPLLRAIDASFVRNTQLFSGLSEAEKDEFLQGGHLSFCPRKKFLFRRGDSALHFHVLCSGIAQMFHETPGGEEVTTDILLPGDALGGIEIFEPSDTYRTHAVAVT